MVLPVFAVALLLVTMPDPGSPEGERSRSVPGPALVEPQKPLESTLGDVRRIRVPIIGPEVLAPPTRVAHEPLTAGEKARLALWKTVGPGAIANRVLWSAYDQWDSDPREWGQGWDAYGKRFANRMGRSAIRQGIMLSAHVAFRTDPRYDLCGCTGVLPRMAHAAKRVLVARTDEGGETVNIARIAGAYATPWVSYSWYPPSKNSTDRKLMASSMYLGTRVLKNIFAEFWPDIRRKVFRRN